MKLTDMGEYTWKNFALKHSSTATDLIKLKETKEFIYTNLIIMSFVFGIITEYCLLKVIYG